MQPRQYIAMGLGAAKANLFGKNTPLSVMLSVTNRCNCKCGYCDIPTRKQKEMSQAQLLNLIDEMSAAGVQKLSLWGGEPLLRDDLGAILSRAKEKRMWVNIDSNGYLIPERLQRLGGLDFIILSFDGQKDTHDANREPGAYDKFLRAVESINGSLQVWTLTVLTRNNIDSVDFIIETARKYGFKTLFQVPYHPEHVGSSNGLMARPDQYRKVFSRLAELKRSGAPIISSTRYLEAVARWDQYPRTTSHVRLGGFPRCWAGKLFCNIDTNGDMYTCSPMIASGVPAPNVLEEGFGACFAKLRKPRCYSCLSGCSLEANFAFSFNLKSITEWMGAVHV